MTSRRRRSRLGPRPAAPVKPHLDHPLDIRLALILLAVLAGGLFYMAYSIYSDISASGGGPTTILPFLLLGVAMLIALGFEFVNGFHDTANAVATVIYTHALPAQVAVVWSGCWNLLGVLASSGAVAFGIVSLLPVELILQVGSSAGYAMVFALLIAAIIWNLGTWWLGIPASSSHTLIGSIVGVGVANALMRGQDGTSGVDWDQVTKIGEALLFSPLFGFFLSALLLLAMKAVIQAPELYTGADDERPADAVDPRPAGAHLHARLVLSRLERRPEGHGPHHADPDRRRADGLCAEPGAAGRARRRVHRRRAKRLEDRRGARRRIQRHRRSPAGRDRLHPRAPDFGGHLSVARGAGEADQRLGRSSTARSPGRRSTRCRTSATTCISPRRRCAFSSKDKESELSADEKKQIGEFKKQLDYSTKFIPLWVKICVAIALGLGTMVGWKRIVVTVGEKIGKTHLTYGQGAAAEIIAAATIGAADGFGLPVSTTHVLSSGVAGTMVANGSGMQWSTVRSIAMAWVLTLPAAMILSGFLFFIFRHVF